MKDSSKFFAKSWHTRTGSFIFFAVAVLAAACLYSAKWTYGWIADSYPLGDKFIPTLFSAIGLCAAFNLVFMLGFKKISRNRVLCAVHSAICILSGVFCGYTLVLLLNLDQGFGQVTNNIWFLLPNLPYFGLIVGIPFLFFIFLNMKKTAQAICAALVSIAVVAAVLLPLLPAPFEFSSNPLVLDIGGDRYSVVFATNRSSIAYLEYTADGEDITVPDESYGRMNTGRVHHFIVPRDALNSNSYSVRAIEVKDNFSTNATYGDEIKSPVFNFKGEYNDSQNILLASDMHDMPDKLLAAASHFPEPDVFIFLGDFASDYNSDHHLIQNIIAAGADVTKSEIPALFARGNHEISGQLADQFYTMLGLDGFYFQVQRGKFLYTICDSGVDWDTEHGVVNDVGGICLEFPKYREQHLQWLESLPVPPKGTFHFAGLHIPTFYRGNDAAMHNRFYNALKRLGVDMQFSGHTHTLELVTPPDEKYGAPYPLLIVGGPVDGGYSGDYQCAMVQVGADGTMKILAYENTGKQKMDDVMKKR